VYPVFKYALLRGKGGKNRKTGTGTGNRYGTQFAELGTAFICTGTGSSYRFSFHPEKYCRIPVNTGYSLFVISRPDSNIIIYESRRGLINYCIIPYSTVCVQGFPSNRGGYRYI
jgi:hypothetical protein